MDDIELFYKIVESHIRLVHTQYLKKLKRIPLSSDNGKKHFTFKKLPIEDKLLKGYNNGIETALRVLASEFKRYKKRLEKVEKDGKKF